MQLDEVSSIDRPATSLSVETGKLFEVEDILQKLVENFNAKLQRFILEGFAPFLKQLSKSSCAPAAQQNDL